MHFFKWLSLLATVSCWLAMSVVVAARGQMDVSSYCDDITHFLNDQGPSSGDIVDVAVGSANRALINPFFIEVSPPASPGVVVAVSFEATCMASGATDDCQQATISTTQRTVWLQSSTFATAVVLNTLRSAVPSSMSGFMSASLGAAAAAQLDIFPKTADSSFLEVSSLGLSSVGLAMANTSLLGDTFGADRIDWTVSIDVASLAASQLDGNSVPYVRQYLSAFRGIRSSLAAGNVTVVAMQGRCDLTGGGALAVPGTTAFTASMSPFVRGCSVVAVVQGIDDQNIYFQTVTGGGATKGAVSVLGYVPLGEFLNRWVANVPVAQIPGGGSTVSYSLCTNCILSLRPSSLSDTLSPMRRVASRRLSDYLRL